MYICIYLCVYVCIYAYVYISPAQRLIIVQLQHFLQLFIRAFRHGVVERDGQSIFSSRKIVQILALLDVDIRSLYTAVFVIAPVLSNPSTVACNLFCSDFLINLAYPQPPCLISNSRSFSSLVDPESLDASCSASFFILLVNISA